MKQRITQLLTAAGLFVFGSSVFYGLGGCNRDKSTTESVQAALPEKVDFNFHIKPILSDRCFACHGPDQNKREADLRLDTQEGAFAALDSLGKRHAIVAGDLDASEMFKRIISKDPEIMMPPPNSNLTLTNYEIDLIEKWIDQGAEWKEHWSFIPPAKPEVSKVNDEEWVENPIDNFVLNRLEQKGLKPSPESSKETRSHQLPAW